MKKTAALILAAGKGTRMQSEIPKQFLPVDGKPMFLLSAEKFCALTDLVVVVTSSEYTEEVRDMLDRDGLTDVKVIEGGKERFDSSMNGIRFVDGQGGFDQILIHDAARCFVTEDVIRNVLSDTETYGACTAAVPSKDTVKLADENGFASVTPDRNLVYVIQTPQGFCLDLIREAYARMTADENGRAGVTDDAMVVERYTDTKVFLSKGDYRNKKVTTPDDL